VAEFAGAEMRRTKVQRGPRVSKDPLKRWIEGMISDREIWQVALLMVKRYKEDAMLEAAGRADDLRERVI
jgi:hypothetical protein